ncbi:MAG: HD-GYP domain-containing protein [Gammaproteobacteria bacterium]|nr:HD-GYP domain-containing protein [Gammaproteobacteria bacterium]
MIDPNHKPRMALVKIKLTTNELRLGMYVAELDRPWLESPFLFQGFLIEAEDDLARLREVSRFVFVDDLRSSQATDVQAVLQQSLSRIHAGRVRKITVEFEEWKGAARLRDTLARLKDTVETTRERLGNVLESSRQGQAVSQEAASEVVGGLVEAVQRDPQNAQWMTLMRSQNEHIASHCMNVSVMAINFARHLGWNEDLQRVVGAGGMLHDIGMSRVPQWLLDKPGTLSRAEFELMRKHSAYAAGLLASDEQHDPRVVEIVRWHHERLDGSGYPDGLRGGQILPHVQLVSVVDAYESMITVKPYEAALSPSVALTRLHKRVGSHFSRELVESFIRHLGIYPLSSLVRLVNGNLGIVVSSQESNRLKPVLLLVRDPAGKLVWPRKMVNLAGFEARGVQGGWSIDRIVDPDSVDIDVQKILIEEFMMR